MRFSASAVKRFALTHGLEIFQPATLKDESALARLHSARADAMVVAAYGLILPAGALAAVPHALNIHASLLPRWRGAAPIQRAILAGDRETGVSIMRMDAGLDTGPVVARERTPIADDEDAGTLHDKLAALGARMIVDALAELAAGRSRAEPQDEKAATYAAKIEKRETALDWRRPAMQLERAIRAFRPSPGAVASLQGEALKIWRARVAKGDGTPGTILAADESILVACGVGALAITDVQRPGRNRMPVRQFVLGHSLRPGTCFDVQA
jgi:methionyl-tRNA formyltransferase